MASDSDVVMAVAGLSNAVQEFLLAANAAKQGDNLSGDLDSILSLFDRVSGAYGAGMTPHQNLVIAASMQSVALVMNRHPERFPVQDRTL